MLLAMHLPDGLLGVPAAALLCLVSIAVVAYACHQLRGSVGDRLVPLIGMTAAAIFAAQMVNFPLYPLPVSGHIIGGVLAAVLLGPWGAILAITAVLIVQTLVFADGGLLALGTNVFNMAIIGGGCGYVLYSLLRNAIGGRRGTLVGAVVASWLTIPLASLSFALQLSAGGAASFPFVPLATVMLLYHVMIGLGEALFTGLVVSWLLRVRPELIYNSPEPAPAGMRTGRIAAAGLAVGLAIAAFAAPWASEHPDGAEASIEEQLAQSDQQVEVHAAAFAPFPDYALQAGAGQGIWKSAGLLTAVLGIVGTLFTFAVGLAMAALARLGSSTHGPTSGPAHAS